MEEDQEVITIGSATHEKLMSSANSAYMHIHEERNNLVYVCVTLIKAFLPRCRLQVDELKRELLREQVIREVEEKHYK
jgi:hypothetical protein